MCLSASMPNLANKLKQNGSIAEKDNIQVTPMDAIFVTFCSKILTLSLEKIISFYSLFRLKPFLFF
jgi:hypothetical protein